MAAPLCAHGADTQALVAAIKATDLYKFAPFVDWPPSVVPGDASPITICYDDDDPVSATLTQAASGQSVDAHPIKVRRLDAGATLAGCQILYVAEPEPQRAALLDEAKGAPVLTVTDVDGSGPDKGIVNFVMQDHRVRFEIDESRADRSGLGISSKLLSLALPAGGPKT
jgi:hypothetical protein